MFLIEKNNYNSLLCCAVLGSFVEEKTIIYVLICARNCLIYNMRKNLFFSTFFHD